MPLVVAGGRDEERVEASGGEVDQIHPRLAGMPGDRVIAIEQGEAMRIQRVRRRFDDEGGHERGHRPCVREVTDHQQRTRTTEAIVVGGGYNELLGRCTGDEDQAGQHPQEALTHCGVHGTPAASVTVMESPGTPVGGMARVMPPLPVDGVSAMALRSDAARSAPSPSSTVPTRKSDARPKGGLAKAGGTSTTRVRIGKCMDGPGAWHPHGAPPPPSHRRMAVPGDIASAKRSDRMRVAILVAISGGDGDAPTDRRWRR